MQYLANIPWNNPYFVHTAIMVLVAMPCIWLVYKTVSLGRTTLQTVLATAYIAILGLLVALAFIASQLYVLPHLFH